MVGTHCLLKQKILQVIVNAGALEMSRWRVMIYLSRQFLVWHWLVKWRILRWKSQKAVWVSGLIYQ